MASPALRSVSIAHAVRRGITDNAMAPLDPSGEIRRLGDGKQQADLISRWVPVLLCYGLRWQNARQNQRMNALTGRVGTSTGSQ